MKVVYEDHMGSDLRVVNAARVSFGKRSEWHYQYPGSSETIPVSASNIADWAAVTAHKAQRTLSIADQKLIKFLARGCTSQAWEEIRDELHSSYYTLTPESVEQLMIELRSIPVHWTPFAHCQVTLHISVPIFVARQLDKHQVGFVKSESSRRYIDSDPEFFDPKIWRGRAKDRKQGSEGTIATQNTKLHSQWNEDALKYYQFLLEDGVAPEQARMVLPQSMYTEYYWTGSLYGWATLYNKRSRGDAQVEIQHVAQQIDEIIRQLYPISWKELTWG